MGKSHDRHYYLFYEQVIWYDSQLIMPEMNCKSFKSVKVIKIPMNNLMDCI